MKKKTLTSSVYTFEDLIRGEFLYVDKTDYLWNLVQPYKAMYFLARPRRFGKSLTLSTLKAIFQGKKELFKGLAIYDRPYDWKEYPIIHLDNANCGAKTAKELESFLHASIKNIARKYGMELRGESLSTDFQFLVEDLAKMVPVVILLDEYDKPILTNISNPASQEILATLKDFYSTIKKCESNIRFAFVTGVTKFCHVSLFSDLNNLQDISRNGAYATMLGYTQEEFEDAFCEQLEEVEGKRSLSHDVLLKRLKNWYDGYCFAPEAETVYNPVSIANFFINGGSFENYWFATGTTSSLFELMRSSGSVLPDIVEQPVLGDLFDSFDLSSVDIQKLMYQTGYLTIGETELLMPGTEDEEKRYHLRFPNNEVKRSFNDQVMEHYAGLRAAQSRSMVLELVSDVKSGDVNAFMKRLQVLFARIPYNLHGRQERDYQTILFVVFMMMNVYIEGEHHTNEGRIDLVLSAEGWTYVVELKVNHSAEEAMAQIANKNYARGFLGQGKRVMAVGVNFNAEKAQIDNWLAEEVNAQ